MGAMFLDSGFDMRVIDKFFERHFAEFFDTDDPPTIQRHPMVITRQSRTDISLSYASIFNLADVLIGSSSNSPINAAYSRDEQEVNCPTVSAEIYEPSGQVTCFV